MKLPPAIVIQLIHIEGPMKGEIQEFSQPEITIGRHAACDVCFPKDLTIISRHHARIVRDGNRFMLVDSSTNGSFVNGKQVKEAILKDGDVILFAEGGPKLSFLTQILEGNDIPDSPLQPMVKPSVPAPVKSTTEPDYPPQPTPATPPARPVAPVQPPVFTAPVSPPPPTAPTPSPMTSDPMASQPSDNIAIQQVKKPLVIQFGPTLQSFNTLPVVIGNGGNCDFKLAHPAIFERHAQIFYHREQYWIRDLTGKNVVRINGVPVAEQGTLAPEARLSLNAKGPDFRFLGDGRLAEIEPEMAQTETSESKENSPDIHKPAASGKGMKEIGAMMKRMLKR
ncbi:MAG: FHA domain-containing protein [Desulfobacterales bacterium]|jgi:pSer/pThr/pTyr-binding forkhead associated (FHA) protein|nr:FHA domain-containing protein [Desulfobacterales bacterium]